MKKLGVIVCAVLATSLIGCSSNKLAQFDGHYYPQCYDPIAKLCLDQDNAVEGTGALADSLTNDVIGSRW